MIADADRAGDGEELPTIEALKGLAFNQGRFAVAAPDSTRLVPMPRERAARRKFLAECPAGTCSHAFGFIYQCKPTHLPAAELDTWRRETDEHADAAIRYLVASRGAPSTCPGTRGAGALDKLAAVRDTVPAADRLLSHAETAPAWVDWAAIARGQQVFLRNLPAFSIALLNLSLIGGFGAPQITRILIATGYLTKSRDITYRRLFETTQMVVDCMSPGALQPWAQGWRSVMSVRLMHAGVRTWLLDEASTTPVAGAATPSEPAPAVGGAAAVPETPAPAATSTTTATPGHGASASQALWDTAVDGIPINQEDMIVTQLAFSIVVLMGLERARLLGCVSHADMCDYIHLWRYIGHLVGIREDRNFHMTTPEAAQSMLESIAAHLIEPDASSVEVCCHVVDAIACRPPVPQTHTQVVTLTRMLAGDAYSDAIGIPRADDPRLLAMQRAWQASAQTATGTVEWKRPSIPVPAGLQLWGAIPAASSASSASSQKPALPPPAIDAGTAQQLQAQLESGQAQSRGAFASMVVTVVSVMLVLLATLAPLAAACITRARAAAPPFLSRLLRDEGARDKGIDTAFAESTIWRLRQLVWLQHAPVVGRYVTEASHAVLIDVIEAKLGGRTRFQPRIWPKKQPQPAAVSDTGESAPASAGDVAAAAQLRHR